MYKETLSKDLGKLAAVEHATQALSRRFSRIGWALLFLAITSNVAMIATVGMDHQLFIVAAGVIGGYMALNIGANDVANNVGPAVGSRALPMIGALIIAAVFESLGAVVAGGDVVKTISKGIVDPAQISDPDIFIWAMMSALLAAALWVNLATWLSAPVSTTHAVVGGVMGAGVAAAGFGVVDWSVMGAIAASWVISPVMGGIIAAAFLAFIKFNVIYREDKIAGAKRWVPVLVALMAGVFSAYLVMKGLKKLWKPGPEIVAAIGFGVYVVTYAVVRPLIRRKAEGMENRNKSVRSLFTLPLICAAALLSFAHGANDVANAVGPLAAVVDTAATGGTHGKAGIPSWVLFVGAAGITMGLLLFGPKLIRTVGAEITKMNPMRAYCVALAAAITVIVASALGLPVSSTHIAVGAVFGVGFFREWITGRKTHINHGRHNREPEPAQTADSDAAERTRRRRLVRRQHFMTIFAAWIVTVPCAALLGAGLFLLFAWTFS
ncbi:MAG: anion permease [Rhodospirillales bacterium CG15_BIG_FIL_POST_REV_8_21_14_020_66_15]|nr:MAG: anion permease [Rhodospirillales bacterium CG15_BIG_FIL_POST_REV_8_21_14_020_66_15]